MKINLVNYLGTFILLTFVSGHVSAGGWYYEFTIKELRFSNGADLVRVTIEPEKKCGTPTHLPQKL